MEFMDHLCQFGQFGILTFRDGIQEVGGLIPLISTLRTFSLRKVLKPKVLELFLSLTVFILLGF